MADNPEARPENVSPLAVSDTPHAPFIYFEIAPAFGFTNGVVNITLFGKQNLRWGAGNYRKRAGGCRLSAGKHSRGP